MDELSSARGGEAKRLLAPGDPWVAAGPALLHLLRPVPSLPMHTLQLCNTRAHVVCGSRATCMAAARCQPPASPAQTGHHRATTAGPRTAGSARPAPPPRPPQLSAELLLGLAPGRRLPDRAPPGLLLRRDATMMGADLGAGTGLDALRPPTLRIPLTGDTMAGAGVDGADWISCGVIRFALLGLFAGVLPARACALRCAGVLAAAGLVASVVLASLSDSEGEGEGAVAGAVLARLRFPPDLGGALLATPPGAGSAGSAGGYCTGTALCGMPIKYRCISASFSTT